jgi:hypothetical protein
MKGGVRWGARLGLLLTIGAIGAGASLAAPRGPKLDSVTLVIRHRVFHDFRDAQTVKLNQDFILGDTDYSGRVVRYVPDFSMNLETRQITSMSEQPNNPAFQIIVRKKGVPQDTTWALFRMPPHFARKSFFGFQVVRVDFVDHAPMVADTAAARRAAHPDTAHTAAPAPADSAVRR